MDLGPRIETVGTTPVLAADPESSADSQERRPPMRRAKSAPMVRKSTIHAPPEVEHRPAARRWLHAALWHFDALLAGFEGRRTANRRHPRTPAERAARVQRALLRSGRPAEAALFLEVLAGLDFPGAETLHSAALSVSSRVSSSEGETSELRWRGASVRSSTDGPQTLRLQRRLRTRLTDLLAALPPTLDVEA